MIVCESGTRFEVFAFNFGTNQFQSLLNITYQSSFWRKHSITDDHEHIVAYDRVSGIFKIVIYTFNQTSLQFDPPATYDNFTTTEFVRYASLSEDKTYLGISTSESLKVYKYPLLNGNSSLVNQINGASYYHQFS